MLAMVSFEEHSLTMLQPTENHSGIKGYVSHSPTLTNRIYIWMATFHFNGVMGAVSHYSRRVKHLTKPHGRPGPVICDERFAAQGSDDRLDTLGIESSNAKNAVGYWPSHEEVFHKAIQSLPIQLSEYNFIDLGAGRGLPLLLASQYSFKSITGVEYSKTLADAATVNIQIHERQTGSHLGIRCIWGDAADFTFTNEPTIVYLFNPFQGTVMDRVIANIETSLRDSPHDFWIVYVTPWENRKFRRNKMFETIAWNSDFSLHRAIER
jgi:hypothetical protein